MKFNIGDKVKVVRAELAIKDKHIGDVFTIRVINPNGVNTYGETHYGVEETDKCVFIWLESELELVEEKKMFTKSDLKNGDVIVRRNGSVEIAMVDLGMFVVKDGWNNITDINDDLTDGGVSEYSWDIMKVYRPIEKYHCTFDNYEKGKLVFDRERDVKPLYNGKVVCIDLCGFNKNLYTVGKIYQFKDGNLTSDKGSTFPGDEDAVHSFKEWAKWTSSKFIEIKE